jgi:AraC-like DNA-binding protein
LFKNDVVLNNTDKKIKYQNSALNVNEITALAYQISDLMNNKKLFLDKNFSLTKLASEINLPSRTISEVVNRHYGSSFNEMVNKLRVEHSKTLLLEQSKLLTIDAIGEKSGFSSRASFYSNFKKLTNFTPFEFAKNSTI